MYWDYIVRNYFDKPQNIVALIEVLDVTAQATSYSLYYLVKILQTIAHQLLDHKPLSYSRSSIKDHKL
jgi:hypothetical protein